ncbi:pilus assembly protein PilP [Vreelandella zhaodongensis]|uniref:Pilus assembly protein PilP n=1 Tax=Vreelandella zhaodongensis TaxID=1176240 RepID=A0ABX2SU34_VREZH|nr:pilus assembly protein PilP [Halomonas zhaodongensis]NYS45102.1 pilus assembly protein PilP [Halomonas zhaodongensis]
MKRILSLLCAAGLVGCSDPQLEQLDQALVEIRRSADAPAAGVVKTLPAYQSLDYRYDDTRSPFLAAERVRSDEAPVEQQISPLAPTQQRTPEPLESFQLQTLRLVGTLRMGDQKVALIAPPEGDVVSVREGNYLGTNHGLIHHVSPQEIIIVERVFSPQRGWQERQVTLTLEE